MKKTLQYGFLAFFLTFCAFQGSAQLSATHHSAAFGTDETLDQRRGRDTEKVDRPSRIVFGGGIGFGFGTFSFINMNPQIGYRISDNFSAGTGFEWFYQSLGNGNSVRSIGPMLWAQYVPTRDIYLTSNYIYSFQKSGSITENVNQLWVGGGYLQRAGNGALRIGGEYNLFGNQGLFQNNRFRPQISFIYGI